MSDDLAADGYEPDERAQSAGRSQPQVAKPRGTGSLTLKLYKPGQGYYTRVGTAIGLGVLILFGAQFIYSELEMYLPMHSGDEGSMRLPLVYGIPTLFIVLMGALTYWVAAVNRKCNDFFIATEGEMKKVSWSSRREVIGSTKVVIVVVVLMAVFLFVFDLAFMLFFYLIDVLKVGPPWLAKMLGRA